MHVVACSFRRILLLLITVLLVFFFGSATLNISDLKVLFHLSFSFLDFLAFQRIHEQRGNEDNYHWFVLLGFMAIDVYICINPVDHFRFVRC